MTALDVIILTVFIGSAVYGFYRGVIVQVGAVAAVLFAVFLCRIAGDPLARMIASPGAVSVFDTVLAKVLLFVAGYFSVRAVAALFKKATHALALGGLDRLAGAVFCVFQWMLVLSLLLNLWLVIKPEPPLSELSTLANGHAAATVVRFAPAVLGWALG